VDVVRLHSPAGATVAPQMRCRMQSLSRLFAYYGRPLHYSHSERPLFYWCFSYFLDTFSDIVQAVGLFSKHVHTVTLRHVLFWVHDACPLKQMRVKSCKFLPPLFGAVFFKVFHNPKGYRNPKPTCSSSMTQLCCCQILRSWTKTDRDWLASLSKGYENLLTFSK